MVVWDKQHSAIRLYFKIEIYLKKIKRIVEWDWLLIAIRYIIRRKIKVKSSIFKVTFWLIDVKHVSIKWFDSIDQTPKFYTEIVFLPPYHHTVSIAGQNFEIIYERKYILLI